MGILGPNSSYCVLLTTGRMFNPMKNRILGPNPTPGPNGASGWFIKYSLTKLELRRLLAEARLKNESFAIEYIELERGREPGRRVALVEDGSGRRRCRVTAQGGSRCRTRTC